MLGSRPIYLHKDAVDHARQSVEEEELTEQPAPSELGFRVGQEKPLERGVDE